MTQTRFLVIVAIYVMQEDLISHPHIWFPWAIMKPWAIMSLKMCDKIDQKSIKIRILQ